MAVSIIPGYNFGVNEVPTMDLLDRAARDLQIFGIPVDLLDFTVTAIVYGDTSGASGGTPTDVGWLWVDPGGNRVVGITESGDIAPRVDCRMWMAQGGWETSRYLTTPNAAGGDLADGMHLWNSSPFTLNDARSDMDLNETPYGFSQVYTGSPATNTRVLGRGLGVAAVGAQVTEAQLPTHRPGILTDNVNQTTWRVLDQFGGHKPHFAGTVMGRSHGTTGTSFAGVEAATWFVNRNLGKS